MVNALILATFSRVKHLHQRYFGHEPFAAADPNGTELKVSQRQSYGQIQPELPGRRPEGEPRIWEVPLYGEKRKGVKVSF